MSIDEQVMARMHELIERDILAAGQLGAIIGVAAGFIVAFLLAATSLVEPGWQPALILIPILLGSCFSWFNEAHARKHFRDGK